MVLVIVMLLRLGILPPLVREEPRPITLHLLPEEQSAPKRSLVVTKTKHVSGGVKRPVPKPAAAAPAPPHKLPPPPPVPWNVVPLSKEEFAGADISTKPTRHDAGNPDGEGKSGAGAGKDSAAVYGPGEGPGGEQLYNAEWYTKPTDAQMAYYMPATGAPASSWAMIACRTAERYHVEDCRELGESPGSGLARALRQAAWQFLVRPPTVNGRPIIGAWVRIRFDFTREAAR